MNKMQLFERILKESYVDKFHEFDEFNVLTDFDVIFCKDYGESDDSQEHVIHIKADEESLASKLFVIDNEIRKNIGSGKLDYCILGIEPFKDGYMEETVPFDNIDEIIEFLLSQIGHLIRFNESVLD